MMLLVALDVNLLTSVVAFIALVTAGNGANLLI